ncbi:hypothetical protein GCM10020254_41220 [Streptomyces goshikiensis]
MACDLWLVPLVDVLCHSPDNPFAEEIASYDKALGEAGLPSVPVFAYMPGLSGDVAPVAGFDYDALHFLRRAYLLQICGLPVTPVDELGGDYEQLLEMFEPTAQQSHLVWHYDHAGAYVPVDFPVPLANEELLAGGRAAGVGAGAAAGARVRRAGDRDRPAEPAAGARAAGAADLAGGAGGADAARRQPVRAGAARVAGAARGGDPQPGAGIDDHLQLAGAPPEPAGPRPPASPGLSPGTPGSAGLFRGGAGGACSGGCPGGRGKRAGGTPESARPAAAPMDCITSGAGPEENSTIHCAVSERTSSVTSSEKRRSTVRQRSAASPAVPSVGPSTSRTFSEAQSNWSVWRRRWTACAVATSRIQPDVSPKNRSQARQAAPSSRHR